VPTLLAEWLTISGVTKGHLFGAFTASDQPKFVGGELKKLVSLS
jgi:hypothetical protein